MDRNNNNNEIKELQKNSHIGHCMRTSEITKVRVQTIHHEKLYVR
jgi:hypothetical protein